MTPIEMQNYEFSTQAVGGYNKKQVEEFVETVSHEFEQYYRENMELKDRITVLNESIKNYKAMEESLQNTLVFAQNTADDIKKNAQAQAETILSEARISANAMVADVDGKRLEAERKYEEIKNRYQIFKTKFEALLQAELKMFEETNE